MREEFQCLRGELGQRSEMARLFQGDVHAELSGIRAAQAAAHFQFERQGRALVARAVVAGRQAKRARSMALKSRAEIVCTRSALAASHAELKSAVDTLSARDAENRHLRAHVSSLDKQLAQSQEAVGSIRGYAQEQEQLLDEAVVAITSLQT